MPEPTTERKIVAARDHSGNWSAHLASQPETSFGGDSAYNAALRLAEASLTIGSPIECLDDGERVEFVLR